MRQTACRDGILVAHTAFVSWRGGLEYSAMRHSTRRKAKRSSARAAATAKRSSAGTTAERSNPIKFGTSGWRGLIADDFTYANVRLAVTAIADHVNSKTKNPTILGGYDPRFY